MNYNISIEHVVEVVFLFIVFCCLGGIFVLVHATFYALMYGKNFDKMQKVESFQYIHRRKRESNDKIN